VFRDTFAVSADAEFELAPTSTPKATDLRRFDCVSGGAIIQAVLYTFARLPGAHGNARVIEPQTSDLSNLNRYMLLRRSRRDSAKAVDLAAGALGGLNIDPTVSRYEPATVAGLHPLAAAVLIGVDHIPTRWEVQRAWPEWLGVGSTTHYSLIVSFHCHDLGCAGCLHPVDEQIGGNIPTVAFVSFWAGLLLSVCYLRHLAEDDTPVHEQHVSFTPIRPSSARYGPVTRLPTCPAQCSIVEHSAED